MKQIKLTNGQFAQVDDDDYELAVKLTWTCNRGYARNEATRLRMQHLILGKPPKGYEVFHIDHNKLNNQKFNLKFVPHSMNGHHRNGERPASGFYGVSIRPTGKSWASINRDGETYYLGTFDTPEQAARAYDEKARELYGAEAKLNF